MLAHTVIQAKLNIIASILPEQKFIESIGGEQVQVALMVKPGNSPHTYEPKPSQMKDISRADLYLSIGVEFEKVWLPKFANQNQHMKIIDISQGIKRLPISSHDTHASTHLDPHIWTSPLYTKQLAKNILAALIDADPSKRATYEKNYHAFIQKVEETDQQIRQTLSGLPEDRKSFIVFHPSWGYFAKQYGLTQIPIEIDGKAPKPRTVQKLITKARELHIHTILTSPEFSDSIAKQIANELDIKVLKISPLDPNWSQNLRNLAKVISNN
jgi:zinc transport system substrate-binding protein